MKSLNRSPLAIGTVLGCVLLLSGCGPMPPGPGGPLPPFMGFGPFSSWFLVLLAIGGVIFFFHRVTGNPQDKNNSKVQDDSQEVILERLKAIERRIDKMESQLSILKDNRD